MTLCLASNCTVVEQLLILLRVLLLASAGVWYFFLECSPLLMSAGLIAHAAGRGTERCQCFPTLQIPWQWPCCLTLFVAVVLDFCLVVGLFISARKQRGTGLQDEATGDYL